MDGIMTLEIHAKEDSKLFKIGVYAEDSSYKADIIEEIEDNVFDTLMENTDDSTSYEEFLEVLDDAIRNYPLRVIIDEKFIIARGWQNVATNKSKVKVANLSNKEQPTKILETPTDKLNRENDEYIETFGEEARCGEFWNSKLPELKEEDTERFYRKNSDEYDPEDDRINWDPKSDDEEDE